MTQRESDRILAHVLIAEFNGKRAAMRLLVEMCRKGNP
jgi:hypothetical protein